MDNTTQFYLNVILDSGPVPGESTAGGYEGQIDIDGFDFAATAKEVALKKVQKGVKANLDLSRVTISKVFDGASLYLANAMRNRKRFSTATISVDQQFVFDNVDKITNQILIIDLGDGSDCRHQTAHQRIWGWRPDQGNHRTDLSQPQHRVLR